jgi:hypothetical protein
MALLPKQRSRSFRPRSAHWSGWWYLPG